MNRSELAAALGISGSMVTRLAKRGMPVDDVERAARWRRRHLEPTRTKGIRADTVPTARPRPAVANAVAPAAATLRLPLPGGLTDFDWAAPDVELRMTQRLALLASADFGANSQALRIFMALVPRVDRRRLMLPPDVWDQLCPPGFLEMVAPGYDPVTRTNANAPVPESDRPDEECMNVIYEVQCGLLQFNR
jgi:hypothetical protein